LLYIGSNQGRLLAIDLSSQKLAWTFETDASRQNGPALTMPDGSPNYQVAFGDNFYDSMITGVSKMMSAGAILSSPVVVNDVVYVGSTDGFLYALM
jgi:eukaryotic-like serine/threonine-protein kinase